MVTRNRNDTQTLLHVFKEILGLEEDSDPLKALAQDGYTDMPGFLSIADSELAIMTLRETVETTIGDQVRQVTRDKPLLKHHIGKMRSLSQWHRFMMTETGKRLTNDEWFQLDKDAFDDFRTQYNPSSNPPPLPSSQATHASNTVNAKPAAVVDFKRGIKRDVAQYPVLKDDKYFDQFKMVMIAQARAHDIEDVFNPTYKPSTQDEEALFDEKQKFAYAVLMKCIQTDTGKTFVRLHQDTSDAQLVWKKLMEHATSSTSAELAIVDLQHLLANSKIDSSWRGTAQGFLLYWNDNMRKLEEILPTNHHYSSGLKKLMLKHAVQSLEPLANISAIDSNQVAKGEQPLDYASYFALLLSAAVQHDKRHQSSIKRNNRVQHTINYLDMDFQDFESMTGPSPDDYGDSYFDGFEVHRAFQQPNRSQPPPRNFQPRNQQRPYIPPDLWHALPKEAQEVLRNYGSKDNPAPNARNTPKLMAKLHDFQPADDPGIGYEDQEPPSDGFAYPDHHDELESGPPAPDPAPVEDVQPLLAFLSNQRKIPPNDIRRVLSPPGNAQQPAPKNKAQNAAKHTIILDGVTYKQAMHCINFRVSAHSSTKAATLVDRGANGGMAGSDVRLIETGERCADVSGINDHQISNLPISTVAGLVQTQHGPVVAIIHQVAYHGKGSTILSSGQMEAYKIKVDDRSVHVGGKQHLETLEGYIIPIQCRNGLPYIEMQPPTDQEMDELPHVVLTSDQDWDPASLDHEHPPSWIEDLAPDPDNAYDDKRFNAHGDYIHRHVSQAISSLTCSDEPPLSLDAAIDTLNLQLAAHGHQSQVKEPNYEALRPCFAWAPLDVIKKTFAATTQFARNAYRLPFRKHFKSRFPALNVHRRQEPVATDTVYADTPAIDDGATCAQIFVGRKSLVTDVYGMKTDKEFINTLEDNIRRRGAMDKLISDRAQVETSKKVQDILRALIIDDWQSEPHHQHQNFAENRWQTVKMYCNNVLNRTGAPAYTWLLCLLWVSFVLNHLATESLHFRTPMEALTGSTPDISPMLQFHFWEPVYYAIEDASFPSDSNEKSGHFVGIAETVGDALTFKILTDDTQKIIYRSAVRSALNPTERNFRLSALGGESSKPIREIVKTRTPLEGEPTAFKPVQMPTFSPDELIGRTYLTDPDEDGQSFRARIVRKIEEHEDKTNQHPDKIKFLVSVDENKADEIVSYNDILQFINKEIERDDSQEYWRFKQLVGHQGPLQPGDPRYKGSSYNVMVEWEDGSTTYEPLTTIAADDPVTVALYAKEKGLLDSPGWKRFKRIANREQKLIRMVKQAQLKSIRRAIRYKYGYQIPRTAKEAYELDKKNGNTFWQDAIALELLQLHEYKTFLDMGMGDCRPEGYKKIQVHFVFDVKHDGRHKARLVAGGHLTDVPLDSVYSGVVSLRSLRMVIFLAELNGLELYAADVGNAYLEAKTKEKVYFVAGDGFGDLQGHTLIIFKALYGLRSSGARWHERFADTLRDMGFIPSKADPDVWMRRNGDHYEYIAVYVDDLAIAARDPKSIVAALVERHKYKLKGVGPIKFHLGCDFGRDPDGTLAFGPRSYITRMMDTFEKMFGERPKEYVSPLDKGDHPEIDDSPLLDEDGIAKYQSMIGACQWLISLGRFDIAAAIVSLSRFRAAPRCGHMDRIKHLYGYVKKFSHACIRVRTGMPDYSELEDKVYDWEYAVYGRVHEHIPEDIPTPLGKPVLTTTYVDANLYHCLITGRATTGILHLLNGTPLEWFSKRQSTVETATYGSEFVAARIATDQIIDLRISLRYLGVPVHSKSYLFGDNQSVVTSSTIPHSGLNKRHNALSYHRVREAIAADILAFLHVDGKLNVADVLSKHCGFQQAWPLIKPLLFWMGDTMDCDVRGEKMEAVSKKVGKVKSD